MAMLSVVEMRRRQRRRRRRPSSYPPTVSSSSSSSLSSLQTLVVVTLIVLVASSPTLSLSSSSCGTSSSIDDKDDDNGGHDDRDESAGGAAGLCHQSLVVVLQKIRTFVQSGQLTAARRVALEGLWENPNCQSGLLAKTYVDAFDEAILQNSGPVEYMETVRAKLALVDPSDDTLPSFRPVQAKHDSLNCTRNLDALVESSESHDGGMDLNRIWDDACSTLPSPTRTTTIQDNDGHVSSLSSSSSSSGTTSSSLFWNFATTIALPSHLPCCELQPGSWAYLRLPALHEPALRLVIPQPSPSTTIASVSSSVSVSSSSTTTITLDLEQDGYLRLFDVAGILWPTGYLLSLCLGNWAAISPVVVPELQVVIRSHLDQIMMTMIDDNAYHSDNHINDMAAAQSRSPVLQPQPPFALELGAGIGAPSIALARSMQEWLNRHYHTAAITDNNSNSNGAPWIVASDKAPHSLALIMSNAHFNRAPQVTTALLDHLNHTSVQNLKNRWPSGFTLIFGSSLQGLFQDTHRPDAALWNVLDELLDKTDPNAVVLLAHTRSDPLQAPSPQTKHSSSTMFRLVRRVSGSAKVFGGMTTRSGNASDFEVCVFQRTKRGATTYSDGIEL